MSHLATVKLGINDLPALAQACETLGLVLHTEGQEAKHFTWHGGNKSACDAKIALNVNSEAGREARAKYEGHRYSSSDKAFEVGLKAETDGTYTLMFDDYSWGRGMTYATGQGCGRLFQEYATVLTRDHYRRLGYNVTESWDTKTNEKVLQLVEAM